MDRRTFLQRSGIAAMGVAGVDASALPPEPAEPHVRGYRTLGRTGLRVSDISLGSGGGFENAGVVRHAYERGITYFDTAESYRGGSSETMIGEALRDVRDKLTITSKVVTRAKWKRGRMMKALEGSLRRLRTDYVDIYMSHAVNNVARLQSDEWREFTALAKQQGKIRFTGMSGHGGHLIECLDYAIDHDLVDVVLTAYNFGSDPAFYERFTKSFDFVANQDGLPRVLAKAHAKGVGVTVMKTLMGARLNDMAPYEWGSATFPRAAMRWVLSNQNVAAAVLSMKTKARIDEMLRASGDSEVRPADARLLRGYVAANSTTYCRNACSDCTGSCPLGVPIADVLRTRMYEVDYGDSQLARSGYAALDTNASPCLSCANPTCIDACPYGLEIPTLTRQTAQLQRSAGRSQRG